jgi:hypothetical protein
MSYDIHGYNVHYWVFCEAQLDKAIREWANAPTHADISEEACKARFQTVSSFLYSEQATQHGLHKGPEPTTSISDKGEDQ